MREIDFVLNRGAGGLGIRSALSVDDHDKREQEIAPLLKSGDFFCKAGVMGQCSAAQRQVRHCVCWHYPTPAGRSDYRLEARVSSRPILSFFVFRGRKTSFCYSVGGHEDRNCIQKITFSRYLHNIRHIMCPKRLEAITKTRFLATKSIFISEITNCPGTHSRQEPPIGANPPTPESHLQQSAVKRAATRRRPPL